jgi:hypothetical protein
MSDVDLLTDYLDWSEAPPPPGFRQVVWAQLCPTDACITFFGELEAHPPHKIPLGKRGAEGPYLAGSGRSLEGVAKGYRQRDTELLKGLNEVKIVIQVGPVISVTLDFTWALPSPNPTYPKQTKTFIPTLVPGETSLVLCGIVPGGGHAYMLQLFKYGVPSDEPVDYMGCGPN